MARSRREFLAKSSMGLMGAAMTAKAASGKQTPQTPGAPPVFGTAAPVGPAVSMETFAAAEKLVQIEMTAKDLAQAAGNWQSMAAVLERRVGPRRLALGYEDVPATMWNPSSVPLPSVPVPVRMVIQAPPAAEAGPLPAEDASIAYAPVHQLAAWVKARQLTSERLTTIYLGRLKRYQPVLRCTITLCEEHALQQARGADAEIARGSIAGRCMGFHGERRTCWIRLGFGRRGERSRFVTAFRSRMRRSRSD
jgi:hypothetical protein